jgi:uncharacterized Zn-binding protein involved in type VI secretion
MPKILLDGDIVTNHGGGSVTSSATKTYAEGKKVVLDGDTVNCNTHGNRPITNPISTKTYAEGSLIALDGAVASCGAILSSSATKTYAE